MTEEGLAYHLRTCAWYKCEKTFVEQGIKKYCSKKCKRLENHRRANQKPANVLRSRARDKKRRLAAISRGECQQNGCGKPYAAGFLYCQDHLARNRQRAAQSDRGVSFAARILEQDNRCPIGNHLFDPAQLRKRGAEYEGPVRDHCHATGKDRAILCNRHNRELYR